MAYILDLGEVVCVQLGPRVEVGIVQGVRREKVLVQSLPPFSHDMIECDPEAIIDAGSAEEPEEEDPADMAGEEQVGEDCAEGDVAMWEGVTSDADDLLASSSLQLQLHSSPVRQQHSLCRSWLQSKDTPLTLSHLSQQQGDGSIATLLAAVNTGDPAPSPDFIVSLHLLLAFLSHNYPSSAPKLKAQRRAAYEAHRAYYEHLGLDAILDD